MTYRNSGDEIRSLNSYNLRGEDGNGAIRDPDGIGDEDSLGMGDLRPGRTASGCVTFDCASVAKTLLHGRDPIQRRLRYLLDNLGWRNRRKG